DCESMWRTSLRALNEHVAEEAKSGLWYGEVDMDTGAVTHHEYGALQAFFPAVLAMSGDVKRARRLQASCYRMWAFKDIEAEASEDAARAEKAAVYPGRGKTT